MEPATSRHPSLRREFAVPVGGRHPAIHEEVAARNERAVRTHEEGADSSDLVRSAGSPSRGQFDHAPVSGAAWPLSSSFASGVMMIPGLIVLTRAPRLPQRTASAITRNEFPRFEIW